MLKTSSPAWFFVSAHDGRAPAEGISSRIMLDTQLRDSGISPLKFEVIGFLVRLPAGRSGTSAFATE
jgi:hypothetical protein